MRSSALVFLFCLIGLCRPVQAVTIDPSVIAGTIPTTAGDGLNGSFYKFSTTFLTSFAQANLLIAASPGPTATFTTRAVCYPSCNVSTVSDTTALTTYLNGNVDNFSYAVPSWQIPTTIDHSAMVIGGYIAIAQAGTYNFNLGSDDGSILTIGNQVVIDNSGVHSWQIATGNATFTAAGLYAIGVQSFENGGYSSLELWGTDTSGHCFIGRNGNCVGTAATNLFYTSTGTPVPEPSTIGTFTIALMGLALVRRKIGF
jgi:hypothetical protein